MKKTALLALSGFACITSLHAQGPEVTSWMLNTTGATGYNNLPADVQQVQYSASNVYVSCSGIPSYTIGPWANNPNTPTNLSYVFKITRNPVQNTGTPITTPLGNIGVWINGVTMFNAKDAMTYNNQGTWHQNAVVVEAPSFDNCKGHPAPGGAYHQHQNPSCLYTANASAHSPLLGYAFDGFPVYGPYAYQNTNGTGAIVRMQSSYALRSIAQRTTLPDGTQLSASQYGPAVSTQYPLGYYIEDFEYITGSGDLDEHNGRFCVTPEYPNGTYAYFVTIDQNGNSAYPYIIGPEYYGTVQAGNTGPNGGHNTITETVTNYTGTTGISDALAGSIKVYPVPATDEITLDLTSCSAEVKYLTVTDMLGNTVISVQVTNALTQLSIAQLPAGIYMINILENNQVAYRKKITRL